MQSGNVSVLDRPEILNILFHPRPAPDAAPPEGAEDINIAAPDGVSLGCRFYPASKNMAHILFFHGNGEIAADYDAVGPVYRDYGLNFIVADYRAYGKSTGTPTVTAMLSDAHLILDGVRDRMNRDGRSGSLWLMGRSLGSAPALELAAARPEGISGLIIESGFAGTVSLLSHLGIDAEALGLKESAVFSNADKIGCYKGPTLIIHAQYDHIIPLDHGKTLYKNSPSKNREMEVVANADHNTVMIMAGHAYFKRISDFIRQTENRIY